MNGIYNKELDMRWAGNRKDIHIETVIKICSSIIDRIPDCSIGITGSVAKLKHNTTSDIDLLVISDNFAKNRQHVFFKKRYPDVNMLCLSPKHIAERFFEWSISFSGQHLNYIYLSNIIYDPNNQLKQLLNRITAVMSEIENKDALLIKSMNIYYTEYIKNIKNQDIFVGSIDVLNMIINVWFIKNGIKLKNTKEHNNAFNMIKEIDEKFYMMIYNAIEKPETCRLLEMICYVEK
jgi:hypothetical protein